MGLFSVTLTLFMIMNPLGNIQELLSILKGIPAKRQKQIILRELGIALVAILFFDFMGEWILSQFAPRMAAVHITAGVILFIVALRILFPGKGANGFRVEGEPCLVPIAIPIIASPALLATIMLYAKTVPNVMDTIYAAFIALAACGACYLAANFLFRTLRETGLLAIEKLMGMVLILIATQQVLHGIFHFFATT